MTLKEFMSKKEGEEIYHIGARCGYICVVTKEEYDSDFPGWENAYLDKLTESVEKAFNDTQKELEFKTTFEDQTLRMAYVLQKDAIAHNRKKAKAVQRYKKLLDSLWKYTPLSDREVKETYNRETGGVAVIIEGDEEGSFWFRDEYVEWKESETLPDATEEESEE